jgi:hypothetical protein
MMKAKHMPRYSKNNLGPVCCLNHGTKISTRMICHPEGMKKTTLYLKMKKSKVPRFYSRVRV